MFRMILSLNNLDLILVMKMPDKNSDYIKHLFSITGIYNLRL